MEIKTKTRRGITEPCKDVATKQGSKTIEELQVYRRSFHCARAARISGLDDRLVECSNNFNTVRVFLPRSAKESLVSRRTASTKLLLFKNKIKLVNVAYAHSWGGRTYLCGCVGQWEILTTNQKNTVTSSKLAQTSAKSRAHEKETPEPIWIKFCSMVSSLSRTYGNRLYDHAVNRFGAG